VPVLVTLALVGFLVYRVEVDRLRSATLEQLALVGEFKARQLSQWFTERERAAVSLANSPVVGQSLRGLLENPGDADLHERWRQHLDQDCLANGYANAAVVLPDARVLVTARPLEDPLAPDSADAVAQSIRSGAPVLSRIIQDGQGHPYFDIATPVSDGEGGTLAILVYRIAARDFLYPTLQFWPVATETAETYLVGTHGDEVLFLSTLRFHDGNPLAFSLPLTRTELPAVQGLLGNLTVNEGIDYRGEPVLADVRLLPGSPWCLVTEIDRDEVLRRARGRAAGILAITSLALLAVVAMAVAAQRRRQGDLYQRLYQVERDRNAAEAGFKATIQSMADGLITTDAEGRIGRLNPVAESLTGWSGDDAAGQPLESVLSLESPDGARPLAFAPWRIGPNGTSAATVHATLRGRGGDPRPVAVSGAPLRDEGGAVEGAVLVVRDQTEVLRAREAEEALSRLLDELARHVPGFLFQFRRVPGQGTRFLYASPGLARVFDIAPEELDRDPDAILRHVAPEDVARIRQAFGPAEGGTNRPWDDTFRVRLADGALRWIHGSANPVPQPDGSILWHGYAHDVTARMEADAALALAYEDAQRSNRELEQFAYVASHDLQEPLRMVSSFTQLLERRYADRLDEKGLRYIHFAVDGAVRMQRLIDDLLTYSRVGTRGAEPAPVCLEKTLEDVRRNLAAAIDESGATLLADPLPVVYADPTQMMQLLQNLIANAIKFRAADPPRIRVSAQSRGDHWEFSVQDNGIGIAPQYHDRVFTIFQRLHTRDEYAGNGIGLAVCKRIVERHNGKIWIGSAQDGGCVVHFTLPTTTEPRP
jgi:PAS domain S-box-containing protein